jgi:DNA-binding transcriptional LysR family regulator
MGPNIHHLLLFEAVSRSPTITAAAERLMISQPAVSKQLQQLERAIGAQLVQRGSRRIRLTEAGQAVATLAQQIVQLADQVPEAIADLHSLRRGRLRIGATPSIATYLLPDLLVRFSRKFPGVRLHVETENTPLLASRLADRAIDVALAESSIHSPQIRSRIFAQDEMLPVAPPDHPLAKKITTLHQFLAESLISHAPIASVMSYVEQVLHTRGFDIKPAFSLPSTEAIKRAVSAGLGVAIIPRLSARAELRAGQLAPVSLKDFTLKRPLCFCTLTGTASSKALIALDCLLKHAVRGTLPPLK